MSDTKSAHKLHDQSGNLKPELQGVYKQDEEGEVVTCNSESGTYAVTVTKKLSGSGEDEAAISADEQKSFISIHSTDQLCQVTEDESPENPDANVEVLTLNEVFPSTSEESLADDETQMHKKQKNKIMQKSNIGNAGKSRYVPTHSKSTTNSYNKAQKDQLDQPLYSDFDLPKNTFCVIGSNPGEPKMSYPDTPKKISKTMKKFLRNMDKHKSETSTKGADKLSKMAAVRSILKDGACAPECTGDSSVQHEDSKKEIEDTTIPFSLDYAQAYSKHHSDKNVSFNTQVVIIHFNGDLCVGQSVETLSKEKDQQARNSELRKTFLSKYNEFWPTQK